MADQPLPFTYDFGDGELERTTGGSLAITGTRFTLAIAFSESDDNGLTWQANGMTEPGSFTLSGSSVTFIFDSDRDPFTGTWDGADEIEVQGLYGGAILSGLFRR
ncbi:hypothetical protein ACFL5A_03780 [Gemmatimonadota bacterium]